MKYGVIGTGWITEAFIRSADSVTGMTVTTVLSRSEASAKAFAERIGRPLTWAPDLETLAESDVEAVYVASPNVCHYQQCRFLLEHGLHVISEKPCAVTPGQVKRLQDLAEAKGLVYMEAIMMMYLPQRDQVKKALPRLGRIHTAHIDFSQLSSKYPAYLEGRNPNIFNPACATGGLMDLGIYCVYPILDWFGMPRQIHAKAQFLDTGADHSGSVIFEYEDKLITMTYSKIGQGHAGSEIIGDQGSLRIGLISQLTDIRFCPPKGNEEVLFGAADKVYSMAGEAAAFRDAVLGVKPIPQEKKQRMLEVSEVMAVIREEAGIVFPEAAYAETAYAEEKC